MSKRASLTRAVIDSSAVGVPNLEDAATVNRDVYKVLDLRILPARTFAMQGDEHPLSLELASLTAAVSIFQVFYLLALADYLLTPQRMKLIAPP